MRMRASGGCCLTEAMRPEGEKRWFGRKQVSRGVGSGERGAGQEALGWIAGSIADAASCLPLTDTGFFGNVPSHACRTAGLELKLRAARPSRSARVSGFNRMSANRSATGFRFSNADVFSIERTMPTDRALRNGMRIRSPGARSSPSGIA